MARRNIISRGVRRKTQWGGFGSNTGTAVLPGFITLVAGTPAFASSGIVVQGGLGFVDEEVTITRMIGHLSVAMGIDTAVNSATVAVGCLVARNEAIAAGVASLPSPEDDPDSDWLFYAVIGLINPQNALRDGPSSSKGMPFDVKGQRIVRAGEAPVWIAESQTSAVQLNVGGRYLVKLP